MLIQNKQAFRLESLSISPVIPFEPNELWHKTEIFDRIFLRIVSIYQYRDW